MENHSFNIEPKPVEIIPSKSAKELANKPLTPVVVDDSVGVKAPTFSLGDYYNILKGFAQRKSLEYLGLEQQVNIKLIMIIGLLIVVGLIILKVVHG